jgi:hypothetical protein
MHRKLKVQRFPGTAAIKLHFSIADDSPEMKKRAKRKLVDCTDIANATYCNFTPAFIP